MKNSKKLSIIIFIISIIGMLCIGKSLIQVENLEDELYSEQLKNLDLTIENERLLQLFNLDDWKMVHVTATAYAPLDNKSGICADGNPNVTSVGVKPGPGVIAVNPDLIPYYSEMIIVGDGWAIKGTALDTGGKMRQEVYWVDIFQNTYEDAINFGKQQVIVFFKEANPN